MPMMDGIEFVSEVRSDSRIASLSIFMLTVDSGSNQRRLDAGADTGSRRGLDADSSPLEAQATGAQLTNFRYQW
ncbi:MAG: hypothetical protein HRU17_14480 [Polyangiaceae bacterium]|nr:hypothetical protein [Polyangiaceae bacterium]